MADRLNSLGFAKPESATRVVVAMSGGVDSSVVAALLKEQGYDVVGVTLQLYDHGAAIQRKGACCAGQDIYDARQVADRIGIAHYVLDYESRFKAEVIDTFVEAYVNGETPVPCVTCNRTVKFRDLLATARDLGADALATGHYVRRTTDALGRPQLRRGADEARDQSYFLFGTTVDQLALLRFPLGDFSKDETRRLAERFGLAVASKPDSQDICFVPNGDYAGLVERLRPEAGEPGDIVDVNGTVIGSHRGVMRFTVGQRRGLDVGRRQGADNEPLYVVRIDPRRRRVVVGPRAALGRRDISLRDVNWLGARPERSVKVLARVRSSQTPQLAEASASDAGRAVVGFDAPLIGAAPGQACVLYDANEPDRVLGGGWIERDDDAPASVGASP